MEFKKFEKIGRLSKNMVITEKIDWTNWCIIIDENNNIQVQSRNKIITPWKKTDNYWFALRVESNKDELLTLWKWYHYWERYWNWIQRTYWLNEKRFALFNTWTRDEKTKPKCCEVVPVLSKRTFDTQEIDRVMLELKYNGSKIAPWFMNPEWIVIFHTASYTLFKKTFDFDKWKWNR